MSSGDRATIWVVKSDDDDCNHLGEEIEHVGDDGVNSYYQCTRCETVLISRVDQPQLNSRLK